MCIFVFYFFPDQYKNQEVCDKAVDDFLPALTFVPDWFVTSKIIKNLHNTLFTYNDIVFSFFFEDSGNITFSSDKIGILKADLDNINLDDFNFYEAGHETVIHLRSMDACNKTTQNNAKHLKAI